MGKKRRKRDNYAFRVAFVFIMCDTECCKDIMAMFVMSRWGVSILFCSIMFVIFHNAKFKCIRLEWNMFLMLKFSLIAL